MYLPKSFEQPSVEQMHELIRAYPLASLITHSSDGLCANHVPMHLSATPEPYGLLSGHVPRANPVWRDAGNGAHVMLIFHGPNAYITPSWYAAKALDGRVVPTWNYTVVHAHGRLRVIDDAQWLRAHLEQLTDQQESSQAHPWAVADAPIDYTDQLMTALIGLEIVIDKLVGKWKLSQNRSAADRAGVVAGLRASATGEASQMAALVERGTG